MNLFLQGMLLLAPTVGLGAPCLRIATAHINRGTQSKYRVIKWKPKKVVKLFGEYRYTHCTYYVAQRWTWRGWKNLYMGDADYGHHLTRAEAQCENDAKLIGGVEVISEFNLIRNPGIDAPRLTKG